jgi:hypothetical protein
MFSLLSRRETTKISPITLDAIPGLLPIFRYKFPDVTAIESYFATVSLALSLLKVKLPSMLELRFVSPTLLQRSSDCCVANAEMVNSEVFSFCTGWFRYFILCLIPW